MEGMLPTIFNTIKQYPNKNDFAGQEYSESIFDNSSIVNIDNDWFTVDLIQATDIILRSSIAQYRDMYAQYRDLDISRPGQFKWPLKYNSYKFTKLDIAPTFSKLNDETNQFVAENKLGESVMWLQSATPGFFSGATFEIEVLPMQEDDSPLLALRIFSSFDTSEFRKRRHQLCESMLREGHKNLYDVISVFQRRVSGNGWKAVSWRSSIFTQ